jgi:hypothetical protein
MNAELKEALHRMSSQKKKIKPGFVKSVAKGTANGLGKLGKGVALGVAGELVSIFTLGLVKPPKR